MLSVIVCTRDPALLAAVSASVARTVGVPHEIVAVDNADRRYSIFEAYNVGAERARFDVLCFSHEDVLFHTDGWGAHVLAHLADRRVGLLGVAGSTFKSRAPHWWMQEEGEGMQAHTERSNFIQHSPDGRRDHFRWDPPGGGLSAPVVLVDGLWMACRRAVWAASPFDATTYDGFHLYDLDFSFGVRAQGLEVRVVYDVLIEHFSWGTLTPVWMDALLAFSRKWEAHLPALIEPYDEGQVRAWEAVTQRAAVQALIEYGYPQRVVLRHALALLRLAPRDPASWAFLRVAAHLGRLRPREVLRRMARR